MTQVPGNLQFELAMLWRTLSIIENVEGLSVVDFYEKYTPTVQSMPALSLSAYWAEVQNLIEKGDTNTVSDRKCLVGVPGEDVGETEGHPEAKRGEGVMNIPELDYLRHGDHIDHKHDPLGLVQNIYGAAASVVDGSSPYNRSVLLSACLALAVKSGRASLLLHLVSLLTSLTPGLGEQEEQYVSVDLDPLKDICTHIRDERDRISRQPAANGANQCVTAYDWHEEALDLSADPLAGQRTLSVGKSGMVLSFGKADHGKLGHGDVQIHRLVPTVVDALHDVEIKKGASMSTYTVAIDTRGGVYVWGTGGSAGAAQTSKADIQPQLLEALPMHARVTDVSCGLGHALFLLHTGRVYAWGNGGNGRLGLGDLQDCTEACPVVLLQHDVVAAVQCGASHSLALTNTGKIYSWGKTTQGQCGHGTAEDQTRPQMIRKLEDKVITQVAAGWEHSLALTQDGRMYSWGSGYKDNRRGVIPPVLGLGHNDSRPSPELISSVETVSIVFITCGWDHCLAIDDKGKVLSWGSGQNGKLGHGNEENVSLPCYIAAFGDEVVEGGADGSAPIAPLRKGMKVVHVAGGCEHTAALTADGEVYTWGHGDGGRLGHGNNAQCFLPTKVASVEMMGIRPTSVHCGDKFTILLASAPLASPAPANLDPLQELITERRHAEPRNQPTNSGSEAFFSEVSEFIKTSLPATDADADKDQNKDSDVPTEPSLNTQTVDASYLARSMLLLMAVAGTQSSADGEGVPNFSGLAASVLTWAGRQASSRNKPADALAQAKRAVDREYAVECADSTFTNLLVILEKLLPAYLDEIAGLVDPTHNALNAMSVASLESSMEDYAKVGVDGGVGSPLGAHTNNNQNASFVSASIVDDYSQVEEHVGRRLAEHFEAIFCAMVVFAANLEVLAERSAMLRETLGKPSPASSLRRKDWRNIQRELGRIVSVDWDKEMPGGRDMDGNGVHDCRAASDLLVDDDGVGYEDEEDEEEHLLGADGDAEYSLGSVESEERQMLQNLARQHHLHDYAQQSRADHPRSLYPHEQRHRHQQDQQSDDGDNRDYHDERSSLGGDHDFGADSGEEDSFFSGTRSRRREMDSYDQDDELAQTRDFDASFTSQDDHPLPLRSLAAVNAPPMVVSAGYAGGVPAAVPSVPGSARARLHPGMESATPHSIAMEHDCSRMDTDRERIISGGAGSRATSPALSFDSLSHPAERPSEQRDSDAHRSLYDRDEPYLSDASSTSRDSHLGGGRRRSRLDHHGDEADEEDDDGDMERYYQEQAQEMENMDLQRAIAASMQSGFSSRRSGALVFDGQPGRFGEGIGLAAPDSSPAVPRIRDQVNTLASKCYLAIESLCGATETTATTAAASPVRGKPGSVETGVQAGTENPSVYSLYLLWEAAQVVTQTGFDVLYTAEEQATVFAQLVKSPSSFMYIIPGIVLGAQRSNRFVACLANVMPSKEALFTQASNAKDDIQDTANTLDLEGILSFVGFCNAYIRDCRDVPAPEPPSSVGQTSCRQRLATAADALSVKMFCSVTRALVVLAQQLLGELFSRIESCSAFLNDTIGFSPGQPFGAITSRILESLVECVQSDLEVLTKKMTVFDVSKEGRFHNSLASKMLRFVYGRCMAKFDVVRASALLPHSIRLLRLYQSSYDAYKRHSDGSREKFNAWLTSTFRWPIYHLAGTFNMLVQPPKSVRPPRLRASIMDQCRGLLNEADVRQRLATALNPVGDAGARKEVYSWGQLVWAALGRTELNVNSRTNSQLPEASDGAPRPVRSADQGVEPALMLLVAFSVEHWHLLDAVRVAGVLSEPVPGSGALFGLQKFLSRPPVEQCVQRVLQGEATSWQSLPPVVQLLVALVQIWCDAAKGVNLPQLATQICGILAQCRSEESRLAVDVSALIADASFVAVVNNVAQAVVLSSAVVHGLLRCDSVANKGASLKNTVAQCKDLLFSGYKIAVPPVLLSSEALAQASAHPEGREGSAALLAERIAAAADFSALVTLVRYCGDRAYPGVSSELVLSSPSRPLASPHVNGRHSHPLGALVAYLATSGLRLSRIAQACLWDVDALRNQQFSMSLLLLVVECLQQSPEAMHHCAEYLHSFGDPLESLEDVSYHLRRIADVSQSTGGGGGATSISSANHRVEQMITKLDSSLTSRMAGLPTNLSGARDDAATALANFGKPSLRQVADFLQLLRHCAVAESAFNQSALVASSLPVPMAPISTALKKMGEALGTLLSARKPEDHGSLTLEDLLSANKFLSLLQSALCGLTTLHEMEKAEKASALVSGKKAGPDRTHEKSAFLHALCSVLTPLGTLLKCLTCAFQQHLLFCQSVRAQYLFPAVKAIEHSSPTILSSVFSPHGSYCLGFWLYLPELSKLFPVSTPAAERTPRRIHLVSRVLESGELNLVTLLSSDAAVENANFSLSVTLVVQPAETAGDALTAFLEVAVTAMDFTAATRETMNTSANARIKAVRKMVVRSRPLPVTQWTSCVVELAQDSVQLPSDLQKARTAVGAAARAQARREYKTKYSDTTAVALIVNSELQASSTVTGGRSAHYQNMVVGKIPNGLGLAVRESDQLLLTDVFWVPSSLYLRSADGQGGSSAGAVHPVLTAMGATCAHHILPEQQDRTASAHTGQYQYYNNVLPRCPPSMLLESLDNASICTARVLDVFATYLGAPSQPTSAAAVTSMTETLAVPVNLLPTICTVATELLCLGDASAQDSAFKALHAIVKNLPPAAGGSGGDANDPNKPSKVLSPASPAGSAFNAAIQNKAVMASKTALSFCTGLVEDILHNRAIAVPAQSQRDALEQSSFQLASAGVRDIWLRRLDLGRVSVERCLRIVEWGTKVSIDENVLLTGTVGLLNAAVRKGIVGADYPCEFTVLASLIGAGGWAPAAYPGRTATLCPRRLFLHFDPRVVEQCAFPSLGTVTAGSPSRSGVSLIRCDGAYQRADQLQHSNPLLPRGLRSTTQTTEMVAVLDAFEPLKVVDVEAQLKAFSLKRAADIIDLLRTIANSSADPTSVPSVSPSATTSPVRGGGKTLQAKSLLGQFESALSTVPEDPAHDASGTAPSDTVPLVHSSNYVELMQQMAFLRCLAVQLTHLPKTGTCGVPAEESQRLREVILANIETILSIAVQDPIQAVSSIFSSGAFKGVQLDVLKNLLKEGDMAFLEKIALKLWKQSRLDVHPSTESGFGTISVDASLIQLAALQGDAIITETKIRALSHFPSVRLQHVALERMTGRWYYECTLLTDGLIQMGWANALFRCDPVCGQGVGDHAHSWAYDGLRCKKWNVSCEAYGRRWKLGDTVGALVDTDLMEIRFYLNGEDLGQAFEDFTSHEVFPALSLNVRQCVRLNFGQYKFLHPPDEVDGKAFKPVLQALIDRKAVQIGKPPAQPASATKAKSVAASPGLALTLKGPVSAGQHPADEVGDRAALDAAITVPNSPVPLRAFSNDPEPLAPYTSAVAMSPLRQALRNAGATPMGAETPSTHMDTPARGELTAPSTSLAATPLDAVMEAAHGDSGYATPSRNTAANLEAPAGDQMSGTVGAEVSASAVRSQLAAASEWGMRLFDRQQQAVIEGLRAGYEAQHGVGAATRATAAAAQEASPAGGEADGDGGDAGQDNEDDQDADLERLIGRDYERDEEDDDEEEEEMDAEDEHRERIRDEDGDDQDQDDEEEEEVTNHISELRRQGMIESLIGMGFPVEWALRAAEHCDVSASESAAITWIIERMEMEQSKMDELEADASRAIDEEEQEEGEGEESALDYYMHRNVAAFRLQRQGSNNSSTSNGPAHGGGGTLSMSGQTPSMRLMAMQRAANPTDAAGTAAGGGMGGLASGSGVSPGGSPSREEPFALRRGMSTGTAGEEDHISRATGRSAATTTTGGRVGSAGGRGGVTTRETQLYDDLSGSTPWNADYPLSPVLPGQYVARHRHDQDKQEVLSQVVELERADMLPIILACEFSLCVYYARTILMRSMALIDRESVLVDFSMPVTSATLVVYDPESETPPTKNVREVKPRAVDSMGLSVLSTIVQQTRDAAGVDRLCSLFAISFKQHVVALAQPDRLLPLLMNGNAAGDARDRVPPFAPFLSANALRLNTTLAQLELLLFTGSEGSLAVEDTSVQGLRTLFQLLDVLIHHSASAVAPAATALATNPSSISSNLSELQTQLLRNMGVTLDTNDSIAAPSFGHSCKSLLLGLVRNALDCLQAASAVSYENVDWFSTSMDRHEKPPDGSSAVLEGAADTPLPVAFAYWLLRNVLVKSALHNRLFGDIDAASGTANGADGRKKEDPAGSRGNSPLRGAGAGAGADPTSSAALSGAYELLTSADTLATLLKLSSSQNLSLRFCVYDLCALVLSSVNNALRRGGGVRPAVDGEQSDTAIVALPQQPAVSAAEYYITIAKEKRLLQIFGARMKTEGQDRRMYTRFTRAVGAFLFQWHLLRRQLGLSSLNYMHEYLMSNIALQNHSSVPPTAVPQQGENAGPDPLQASPQSQQRSDRAERESAAAPGSWAGLRITQLTSNSVTVDWRLDEKVFRPVATVATASALGQEGPVKTYDANLYFTAASHMGLETPVLVLSNLELAGTFHIDDLESDTLYKITISKENPLNASSDQEEEGEQRPAVSLDARQRPPGALSFFDNGAAISTPYREQLQSPLVHESSSPAGDNDRKPALDTPGAASVPGSSAPVVFANGRALAPFPDMSGLTPQRSDGKSDTVGALPARLAQQSLLAENTDGGNDGPTAASQDSAMVVRDEADPSKGEVVVFISTECEPPFQFDPDQTSPHISVAPHSLTLHNMANKKWSTARASARLTSGIYRWDVHIDRCISKNIFIGVAAKEARLDNYVGCDKHGWAFLANKAVWHNKAKVKAYGELFRTGDTVTVIVDLDEGTLSYCLNGKSLGIAVEGLTGPVYPAFSLYNEDDQITIVQMVTAGGDSSSGTGSCAAEKVLERVETFSCLLQCVTDVYGRELARAASKRVLSTETAIVVAKAKPEGETAGLFHAPFITEELGAELLTRWELWKAEIPVRSFIVGNDLVTICGSAAACTALSRARLHLWENVSINSERAVLIGASQHKLWFRMVATGELVGVTADGLEMLISKGCLASIELELAHQPEDTSDEFAHLNEFRPILKSPTGENLSHSAFFSFEISASAMRDALAKLQRIWKSSDDAILLNFLALTARMHGATPFNLNLQHVLRPTPSSTAVEQLWIKYSEEDVALRALLLLHLNDLALPLLPLLCPYSNADEEAPLFAGANACDLAVAESVVNHPAWRLKEVRHLLLPHVKREFAERLAVVAIGSQLTIVRPPQSAISVLSETAIDRADVTSADAAATSVPVGTDLKTGGNALQSILTSLGEDARKYLDPSDTFPPADRLQQQAASPFLASLEISLTGQMSPSTSVTHPNTVTPSVAHGHDFFPGDGGLNTTASDQQLTDGGGQTAGTMGIVSNSTPYLDSEQMLVLEVTEEARMSQYVYCLAAERGVSEQLLLDDRWRFVSGIQCSFLGQMLSFFEQVAGLNANCAAPQQELLCRLGSKGALGATQQQLAGGNAAAWENYLRSNADSLTLFWAPDTMAPKQRSVPFLIRTAKWPTRQATYGTLLPEELPPGSADSKLFQLLNLAQRNPDGISEWCLFAAFVDDACAQASRVIQGLYGAGLRGPIALGAWEKDPAYLNLGLQLFHATGVLVGLAVRVGAPVFLSLPEHFIRVLSNAGTTSTQAAPASAPVAVTVPAAGLGDCVTDALALSLRMGVISTFPEPAWDLLSPTEVAELLRGGSGCNPPLGQVLQRHATYEAPVSRDDLHVQMFWAAVCELAPYQVRNFLRALLPETMEDVHRDAILYGTMGSGQVPAPHSHDTSCDSRNVLSIHILPPTAVAMLSPDASEITLFPDRIAVALPRYSSLRVLSQHLLQLVSM